MTSAQTNSKKEMEGVKIEKIDENQVKITLSCTEMLTMNAQSAPEESSRLMWELLGALENEFRFSILNQAIVLELVPSKQDGCEIFLTKTDFKKQKKCENNLVITSFSESEEALYAGRMAKQYVKGQIAIYLMNGEYYLAISSVDRMALSKIQLVLCDLGSTVENPLLMEGVLKEYGTLILEEDAPPLLT